MLLLSNRIITFSEFTNNNLNLSFYDSLYVNIEKILKKNIRSITKQRRLEHLFNAFLLSKVEKRFRVNPMWANAILDCFRSELLIFSELLPDMLSINFRQSELGHLWSLFVKTSSSSVWLFLTPMEIFSFIISTLFQSKDFLEDGRLATSSFIPNLARSFIETYTSVLAVPFVVNFLEQNYDYILDIKVLYKSKLPIVDDLILLYCRSVSSDSNLDRRYSSFKRVKSAFDLFYKTKSIVLYDFIYKYFYLSLDCLETSKVLERAYKKFGVKMYRYSSLFNLSKFVNLRKVCFILSQIPMVSKPTDWDRNGHFGGYLLNKRRRPDPITLNIPTSSSGYSSLKFSSSFLSSINLLQSKPYSVDTEYLAFIKHNPLFWEQIGLKSESTIYMKYIEYVEAKRAAEPAFSLYSEYLRKRRVLQKTSLTPEQFSSEAKLLGRAMGVTTDIVNTVRMYHRLKKQYHQDISVYLDFKFVCGVVSALSLSSTLYLVNRVDFRGRVYPAGRLIHRAGGLYKYLLKDPPGSVAFKYNQQSFNYLKFYIYLKYIKPVTGSSFNICVLNFDQQIGNKIARSADLWFKAVRDFVSNDGTILDLWASFIEKRPINIPEAYRIDNETFLDLFWFFSAIRDADDSIPFLFGLYEYTKALHFGIDTYISNFCLEIDQSASGPMIYSLLCKSQDTMKLTNLLTDTRSDIYEAFSAQLLNYSPIKNNPLVARYKEIFQSRNFSKLLLMPLFYNMQSHGVAKHIEAALLDNFYAEKSRNFYREISELSALIYKRSRIIFSKDFAYQSFLTHVGKILYKRDYPVTFKTVDGSVISYKYQSPNAQVRKYKKPTGSWVSYRVYYPVSEADKLSKRHFFTFSPNYIHMLDGSISRIVVKAFYELSGIRITPLHDAFTTSVNAVISLINLLKYVYLWYFTDADIFLFRSCNWALGFRELKVVPASGRGFKGEFSEWVPVEPFKERIDLRSLSASCPLEGLDSNTAEQVRDLLHNISLVNDSGSLADDDKLAESVINSNFMFSP